MNEIIKRIKTLAAEETEIKNNWVEDYFGGNTLDAYNVGQSDGKILLAQELLKLLKLSDKECECFNDYSGALTCSCEVEI